ncbi:PREDICTED: root phototropism protein 3-like [Camelina sativa]|uniref:Root phototropism protein 3-like n=1 Tax=Camelina sativa TaxID=90675 RepID=A0ABM0VWL3_CAMSA|nr:PREDICTED: root phototropism protein 3-like [Camelina sativa]
MVDKTSSPESATISTKSPSNSTGKIECSLFDDGCILDIDYFVNTIAGIKSKGVRPDLIGSIIVHYASTWLPDLSDVVQNPDDPQPQQQSESFSVTAFMMKKRFLVETLIGIIPPEKDSVPCNFLLRLLRTANMVGADSNYKSELEAKISWQLDQASLKELMIPSFSHTCGTLLDVELVTRLVKKFTGLDNEGVKSGASLVKVAKLVDSYLAEAALDGDLSLPEFMSLAEALPYHARVNEDGLYRAIDTYLKAHSKVTKQEKKRLCGLIDNKKLSMEASLHAAQNDRLPVRTILQVLFSEQTKLSNRSHNNIDWSGSSFSGVRSSPNPSGSHYSESGPARCMSKREINVQHAEIRRLREDMANLKSQCEAMQTHLHKLIEKKGTCTSGKKGFFRWTKLGFRSGLSVSVVENTNGDQEFGGNGEGEEFEYVTQTPGNTKTKLVKGRTPSRWRNSMS